MERKNSAIWLIVIAAAIAVAALVTFSAIMRNWPLANHTPAYVSYLGSEYTDSPFPTFANSGSAVTSHAPRSMASSAAKASA